MKDRSTRLLLNNPAINQRTQIEIKNKAIMKTAMQELIEWLLEQDEMLMSKTRMTIVAKADSLLEKEKDQIMNAWVMGVADAYEIPPSDKTAKGYYNQTYQTKQPL
jgi:Trp operon repressor